MSAGPDERPTQPAITERVRQLCTALPEVTERLSHGECTWFVRGKKVFVQMSDHHHDDLPPLPQMALDPAQQGRTNRKQVTPAECLSCIL